MSRPLLQAKGDPYYHFSNSQCTLQFEIPTFTVLIKPCTIYVTGMLCIVTLWNGHAVPCIVTHTCVKLAWHVVVRRYWAPV